MFDKNGGQLYNGIGGNPGRRFEQHRGEKPWWGDVDNIKLEHFSKREEAAAAELRSIQEENPKYNIAGRKSEFRSVCDSTSNAIEQWTFMSRKTGYERITGNLYYYWEPDGSSMSDDYYGDEIDAVELFREWVRQYVKDLQSHPIFWFVTSDDHNRCFEAAPFDVAHARLYEEPPLNQSLTGMRDFLTYFTWPENVETGELLNWLTLPVRDGSWTSDKATKGGFIQEALKWKPSPLQPYMNVQQLRAAAGI